jgi:hypothetical protein
VKVKVMSESNWRCWKVEEKCNKSEINANGM